MLRRSVARREWHYTEDNGKKRSNAQKQGALYEADTKLEEVSWRHRAGHYVVANTSTWYIGVRVPVIVPGSVFGCCNDCSSECRTKLKYKD